MLGFQHQMVGIGQKTLLGACILAPEDKRHGERSGIQLAQYGIREGLPATPAMTCGRAAGNGQHAVEQKIAEILTNSIKYCIIMMIQQKSDHISSQKGQGDTIMMKTKKCLQIFTLVLTMILCIATVACVDNHEMTEQEQEIAAAAVRAYYEGLPEIMQDYITESSLKELSACDPKDRLFNIYGPGPGEYHHGMFESYSLILKNGCKLVLRYGVIKDEKLADHAIVYSSPEYPCSTMESAIEQIQNHRPSFEDDNWLNDILDDLYATDSDIRAEWAYLYDEMVREISENGIPQHQETDTFYRYRTTKITHITENGNYHFEFKVTYNAALMHCYYEYSVQLEAVKT